MSADRGTRNESLRRMQSPLGYQEHVPIPVVGAISLATYFRTAE
jgi:hypothetical protein